MSDWNHLLVRDIEQIREILKSAKTIAVVGMTASSFRPSYYVPKYLRDKGYEIYPVNPRLSEIDDLKCYPNLMSVPVHIDIVEVFRKSEDVMPHAEEALAVRPGTFWMQSGIINQQAATMLAQAGIRVVMDRCMYTDHLYIASA